MYYNTTEKGDVMCFQIQDFFMSQFQLKDWKEGFAYCRIFVLDCTVCIVTEFLNGEPVDDLGKSQRKKIFWHYPFITIKN